MIRRVALAVSVVVLLSLAGFVFSPYHLEYAASDAEGTAIGSGDAYVVGPTDRVVPGDVVVYWSPVSEQFAATRVVATTDAGYVTATRVDRADQPGAASGPDGNSADTTGPDGESADTAGRDGESADTAGRDGESGDDTTFRRSITRVWVADRPEHAGRLVVDRTLVVGEVVAVAGEPIVLRGVGGLVPTIRTYDAVALSFALGLGAAALWARRRPRDRRNRALRLRDVFVPLFAFLLVASLAVTPLASTTHQLTYGIDVGGPTDPNSTGSLDLDPAGSTGSDSPDSVASEGRSVAGVQTVSLDRPAPPGMRYVVRSDDVTVTDSYVNASGVFVSVRLPEDPEPATADTRRVQVYPYLPWLPSWLLERLHDSHPALAVFDTAAVTVLPLILLGLLLDLRRALPPRIGNRPGQ